MSLQLPSAPNDDKIDDYCIPAVTVNDVLKALRDYPVTVTDEHLKKHQDYAKKVNVKMNELNLNWETLKWKSDVVDVFDVSVKLSLTQYVERMPHIQYVNEYILLFDFRDHERWIY